jgi:hypothetical protein
LGDNDCRFAVGDVGEPGFFFCGGAVEKGHSYCAGHCVRAYDLNYKRRTASAKLHRDWLPSVMR